MCDSAITEKIGCITGGQDGACFRESEREGEQESLTARERLLKQVGDKDRVCYRLGSSC